LEKLAIEEKKRKITKISSRKPKKMNK